MATVLVGRENELGLLDEEATAAAEGQLRCVLVTGDPGVGKSSLAAALLERRPDLRPLTARAHSLGGATSFGLWVEALEEVLRGMLAGEVTEVCGGFVDDLAALVRSVAAARGGPPRSQPSRPHLLEALTVALRNLAERGPLAVVLDDIHWADTSSLDALDYVARNLEDSPLLVFVLARSAELAANQPALQTVLAIEQRGALRRVPLDPLDGEDLAELARSYLGLETVPDQLVAWLAERSRGNPLFARGLLHALAEEGADPAAPALRRLPEGLTEQVAVRLAGREEHELSTLETLAVLGRRVGLDALAEHTARPVDRLAVILHDLDQAGLVAEHGDGQSAAYEIAHPLIQESIYQQMGSARRLAQHRLAARTLTGAGRFGEAAPHYARSARPGDAEAVGALCAALAQAEQRGACQEASAVLEAILVVLPSGNPRWLEVLAAFDPFAEWVPEHRADTEAAVGLRAIAEIEAVLGDDHDPLQRAGLLLRKGVFRIVVEEAAGSDVVCLEAADLYRQAGQDTWARIACVAAAWARFWTGTTVGWRSILEPLLEEVEQHGDDIAAMYALHLWAYAGFLRGDFFGVESSLERAIELARTHDRERWTAGLLTALPMATTFTRGVEAAQSAFAEAQRGDREAVEAVLEYQIPTYVQAGEYAAAVRNADDLLARGPVTGRRAVNMTSAVAALVELGAPDRARTLLDAIDAGLDAVDASPFRYSRTWADGVVSWREGRAEQALDMLRHTATKSLDVRLRAYLQWGAQALGEVAVETGRADDEAGLLEECLGALLDLDVPGPHGAALLTRARLALAAGQFDDAARDAADAIDVFDGLGFRGVHAQSLAVLGEALARTDRTRALAALQDAAELHERTGALWRRDRALHRLTQLGHRGRQAAAAVLGPEALSDREREVAALAAAGLTAKEIAGRLFLSHRTVETHLANTYAKLGVGSKGELIQRRSELGLDEAVP